MILYINACVRSESRTDSIARALLEKLGDSFEEIALGEMALKPHDRQSVKARTEKIARGEYGASEFALARQFATADVIVISAPFWDLSFPSLLKMYIENIYVTGIVSRYDEDGRAHGLCRASKLYYVTTAGGPYDSKYSYDYIRALATDYFGIPETKLIAAEMLDVRGFDAARIVRETIEEMRL